MTFSTGTQNEHVRDLAVHEAIGPAIPPVQVACIISMGVIALLMAGVMPAIFGALADAGRLTEANIGLCATSEGLMMGISAALSGIFLQTERLPLKGICAAVAFAVINIVSIPLENLPLVAVRALAGIPEGIMIWITVGMIARSEVPERWAGVFFTALVSGQLALAFLFAVYVIPHFGAAGGFVTLAIVAAIGAGIASRLPQRYAHLQPGQSIEGVPPPSPSICNRLPTRRDSAPMSRGRRSGSRSRRKWRAAASRRHWRAAYITWRFSRSALSASFWSGQRWNFIRLRGSSSPRICGADWSRSFTGHSWCR
jgi:hypothetical protein